MNEIEQHEPEPCAYFLQHGAHEESTWDGPGRWKCKDCGMVWYGPSY